MHGPLLHTHPEPSNSEQTAAQFGVTAETKGNCGELQGFTMEHNILNTRLPKVWHSVACSVRERLGEHLCRRVPIWPTLLLSTLTAVPLVHAGRPNVILIMSDDIGTGWFPFHANRIEISDLEPEIVASYERKRGHLGKVDPAKHIAAAKEAMPFLAQLAREGIVFDNAFATAPLCAPSRAGLLTGTFQQEWGAYWNDDVDNYGIPSERVVLAEPLQSAGYATAMIGKWHVARKDPAVLERIWTEELGESLPIPPGYKGRWKELSQYLRGTGYQTSSCVGQHPLDRGFDYYFGFNNHDSKYFGADDLWEGRERVPPRPDGEFLTELLTAKTTQFIHTAATEGRPFFVYLAPLTLHGPIAPPPAKYSANFNTGHRFTDEYAGHLRALDEGIRQIFAAVESTGMLDQTLFIFTSDNGCTLYDVPPYNAPNRGGKGTGWLGGLNVPLVIWGMGVQRRGISTELVSLADIMPTILESAAATIPGEISGKSLLPYVASKHVRGPRTSLSSVGIHSSRWSYFYEGRGENNTQDGMRAPLYAWNFDGDFLFMRVTPTRAGLYQSLPAGAPSQVMLFDTRNDRAQRHNIAVRNRERTFAMDATLRAWLAELNEPLTSQKQDFRMLRQPVSDF